jgi:hypothetical protein
VGSFKNPLFQNFKAILTRLITNCPGGRGLKSVQMKGDALFQGEIMAKE